MSFKLKSMPLAVAGVIASGALSMGVMNPATAQTTTAATEEASANAPAAQRVVVTGSLISRTDTETAAPVQVITAQDIQRSGKTSVAELLNDLAANGQGTLGTGFSGAFANGAAGVSLRGLTVGSTLVLIDGHRMATYPLSDDAQRSFVDVSNIPFDAIDSIEILKSGASSLYGSDAIAGVVNIKLKKNLTGTRFTADAGDTQHGGGATKKASLSTGIGDLDTDGYNAFATVEWRRQGAIKTSDRDGFSWDNADYRGIGGNDLRLGVPTSRLNYLTPTNTPFLYNPAGAGGVNNPANFQFLSGDCDYAKYRAGGCAIRDTVSNIAPENENINVLIGMTKKLSGDWELGFKGSLFQRTSVNNRGTYYQPFTLTASPSSFPGFTSLNNGVLVSGIGAITNTLIPASAQFNQLGTEARLYGYIPGTDPISTLDNKSKSTRFALDLHGSAYGWDLSAAGGVTKVVTDINYSGYIDRNALYNALIAYGNNPTAANGFNPLGGNSPAVLAAISPTFSNSLESTLNYVDLVGSRELMQLGAGPLALAAGLHWHKREQNSPAASLTANGQVANTTAFVVGSETNTAAFAELQATPIKNVELHLSSRYDHYDTYGNSFTPAASFKWAPIPQLGFRGTFARGFRAPNPAEVGNAGSFFTFNAVDDPILCADGSQTTRGNVPAACGINPPYVQTTTNKLSPEKSKSYTFGLIVEPVKGLNATLDYYKIDVTNQIVSAAGNDPNYVPEFVRNPPSPVDIANGDGTTTVGLPSVGSVIYATSPYINLGSTKTSGIEADIGYRWRMPNELGTLKANLTAAHTFSYVTQIAGGDSYELAGTQGPSSVGGATGSPKDRAQFSLDWSRGPLDVTTSVNYTSDFSTLDPSLGANDCASSAKDVGGRNYFQNLVQPEFYCHVASFTVVNLNLQYKLSENLTLRGAILNLFDRQPPIDVATYGNASSQTSYNASLHQAGAIGRFFNLGLSYTF